MNDESSLFLQTLKNVKRRAFLFFLYIGCTVYVVFVLFVGVLFVLLRYWRLFPYVFGKC